MMDLVHLLFVTRHTGFKVLVDQKLFKSLSMIPITKI